MRRRIPAMAGFLVLLVTFSCSRVASTTGFDWPQWRGPDGNGQSLETDWDPASIANPKVLWAVNVGLGYSNVAIQAGRLYAIGMTGGKLLVSCRDAKSGRRIWQRDFVTHSDPQSTPTVSGDQLFVLTADGYLYCVDSRNGRQQWKKDIVAGYGAVRPYYGFAGSPVIEGDLVILTANTSGMAVNRETGDLVWTSPKPPDEFASLARTMSTGTLYPTPVLYDAGGGRQALLCGWNGLYSVDVRTGKASWRFAWQVDPAQLDVDPVIAGDLICLAVAYMPNLDISGLLLQLGADGPVLRWRTPDLYSYLSTPVIVGKAVFTGYGGPRAVGGVVPNALRCIALETGRVLWEERFGEGKPREVYSLAAANGILIVLDDQGTLYTATASPEGFREIASCDVLQGANRPRRFWTPPVLCNAKIYCRNFDGNLVCIDVSR